MVQKLARADFVNYEKYRGLISSLTKAAPAALNSWLAVRGARLFIPCLTLLHRFSIGLRSGDYGGKYSSLAPAASMAVRTPATLWVARLSKMTPSSRCSLGTSPCFTQAKNSSPPSARRTATGFVALGDARRQSSWSSENGRGARLRPAARPPRSNSGWRQCPPCSCPVRKDEESVPAPTPEWLTCPNPATPAPYSKATCFMDTF